MLLVVALLAAQAQGASGRETPARPASPPSSWVTPDDYPNEEERQGHEGTFGFLLRVNAIGRPVECKVTRSTGYGALDSRSCSLLLRRARFDAARDAQGNAIESYYSSYFRWGIGSTTAGLEGPARSPGPAPAELNLTVAALPDGYRQPARVEIGFDESGRLNHCVIKESSGSAAADRAACGQLGRLAPAPKVNQIKSADPALEYIVSFRADTPANP